MTTLDPDADCSEDLAGVLVSLLQNLRFRELGETVRTLDALRGRDRRRVLELCRAGSRLLDLDAVGMADVDGVSPRVRQAVAVMAFPSRADDARRGSLDSLVPLYELMLECLRIHWARAETARVTLLLHLMAEYLPMLVWESVVGHAGDPLRLRSHVVSTYWGTPDCVAPLHRRSAAQRVLALRVDGPDGVQREQWQVYLDRWHARVAGHLRQCALRPGQGRPNPEGGGCDAPCGVVTQLAPPVLADLASRMVLAAQFADSPVVALRHAAPVGHFFGVPSQQEVLQQWEDSVTWLCRDWAVGRSRVAVADDVADDDPGLAVNPVAEGLPADKDEPLPGLHALLSAASGRRIQAGRLLHDIGDEVAVVLTPLLAPAVESG